MTWWHRHAYLLLYIVFSVASQLIIRWRVGGAGALAPGADRVQFVLHLLAMPWVWAAFLSTFLAGVMWMLTLGRLDLTYAFPFTGITFLVILFAGALVFGSVDPFLFWVGLFLVAAVVARNVLMAVDRNALGKSLEAWMPVRRDHDLEDWIPPLVGTGSQN